MANLAFVAEATNILLLGPPGVAKTHLAVALGLRAIEHGQGAYFVRAYDLMEDLRKARAEHNLDRRMRVYMAPKVLIVDEFGIWPYDRESATAFFHPRVGQVRKGQYHPDFQQGASANGENSWGTLSLPRPSWTGCSTTATSSTSGVRATGSGKNDRLDCSLSLQVFPRYPRGGG